MVGSPYWSHTGLRVDIEVEVVMLVVNRAVLMAHRPLLVVIEQS